MFISKTKYSSVPEVKLLLTNKKIPLVGGKYGPMKKLGIGDKIR